MYKLVIRLPVSECVQFVGFAAVAKDPRWVLAPSNVQLLLHIKLKMLSTGNIPRRKEKIFPNTFAQRGPVNYKIWYNCIGYCWCVSSCAALTFRKSRQLAL